LGIHEIKREKSSALAISMIHEARQAIFDGFVNSPISVLRFISLSLRRTTKYASLHEIRAP